MDAYLALEGVLVLKHVDELGVVDLQKHPRDLARQVGEHALDEGNEYINVYPTIKMLKYISHHQGYEYMMIIYGTWINGKSLSPSICFCSCGGAAASIVAVRGSWKVLI